MRWRPPSPNSPPGFASDFIVKLARQKATATMLFEILRDDNRLTAVSTGLPTSQQFVQGRGLERRQNYGHRHLMFPKFFHKLQWI